MIVNIASESTMVSDAESNEIIEQPVIIENYSGSNGIGITSYEGHTVYIPYRMVADVIKVMKSYLPKK